MFAIASLLDPLADQAVRDLWERFESHCGLVGIKSAPLPHFTWASAETYSFEGLESDLQQLIEQVRPFRVRTAGLGIFTGPRPVVYISVIKNEALMELHRQIWNAAQPHALSPNGYYDPGRWVPHITLAFREYEPDRLGCAFADAAFQKIELDIWIENLAILYTINGAAGLRQRFEIKEKLVMGGVGS